MICIGITGIIGSGKTTVAKIFECLGTPVYNADINAKRLMNSNSHIQSELSRIYGEDIYINGMLNKKLMAEIIFNSNNQKSIVNSIVHPVVIDDYFKWVDEQSTDSTAIESALLNESGLINNINYIINITTPKELRIQRLISRDNSNREEIEKKIAAQKDESEYNNIASFIIQNDEQKSLIEQSLGILKQIRERHEI